MNNFVKQIFNMAWYKKYLLCWIIWLGWVIADLDPIVADFWYHAEGNEWYFRHDWLFEKVFHDGVRLVVWLGMIVLLLYYFVLVYNKRGCVTKKRRVLALLLSMLATTGIISLVKTVTYVYCPWDVDRYGGNLLYLPVWSMFESTQGACFPAGHAGTGYMLIGFYYFFYTHQQWRRVTISMALFMGVFLGIVQQMRGAHFVSHDIASLLIAWGVSYGIFTYMRLLQSTE